MKLVYLTLLLSVFPAHSLEVFTYSSFLGKGSLGEHIKTEFKKTHPEIALNFVPVKELSGLRGALRSRAGKNADIFLGLHESDYNDALAEGLLGGGHVFARSPFAIIVNIKKLPLPEKVLSWSDVSKYLNKNLVLADPRLSASGEGWIKLLYEHEKISPKDAKEITKVVYPSWSAAYAAFSEGRALAVWSYLSSEAYHLCNNENSFRAVPVAEGYPEQKEFVAVKTGKQSKETKVFFEFLLSEAIQKEIPQKNWMFPASEKTPLPDCFKNLTKVKTLKSKAIPAKEFQVWLDRWSLL